MRNLGIKVTTFKGRRSENMLLIFHRVKEQFVSDEGSTVDTEVVTEPGC